MSLRFIWIGIGILMFTGRAQPGSEMYATAEEPDSIFFHEYYNDALREAKLTKKPIFLEFRCAP